MTRFIPAIRAWQLSRVDEAIGDSQWTHVFEQEFGDLDGLTGPYLMHPIHWAVVDRWFDPECPDVIIRDRLCHSFCQYPTGADPAMTALRHIPAAITFGFAPAGGFNGSSTTAPSRLCTGNCCDHG